MAKTSRALLLTLLSTPLPVAHAFPLFQHKKPAAARTVPLNSVAAEVVRTLDAFNAEAASRDLPPLSRVTFDFNASVAKAADLSFNILLFSVGGHRESDTTNEVTFTYTVPPPTPAAVNPRTRPADFSSTLLSTLEAAAAQVKTTQSIGAARFSDLTVTLAYGVVTSASGGATGTVSIVTLGGTLSHHRSDVQTLTLNFGQ